MRKRIWLILLLVLGLSGRPASAQLLSSLSGSTTTSTTTTTAGTGGVIVRTTLGLAGLNLVCLLNGCTVVGGLDAGLGQVFLVTPVNGLLPSVLAATLQLVTGIVDAEVDQVLLIPTNPATITAVPSGLWDQYPVNYFGATVWDGYVNQPAAQIVRVAYAQSAFKVSGSGIVADIDTGVDPNHPVLKSVLLPGYDFTRNQPGGSEMNDIGNYTPPPCNPCQAGYVNQSSVAMLDQSSVAMLDTPGYAAFGHGTEVLGVVHLVAPTAKLMPLKAFYANGTGNLSDIIRAIYYAVKNDANIINMSFDLTTSSTELAKALSYATNDEVVCIASAGNDGKQEVVYPAALQKSVAGVASTNYFDQRSSFSNYGNRIVWLAAPGEQIITTYPFGRYAAATGTSFSAPFVTGTASLFLSLHSESTQSQVESALTHAQYIGSNMGYGRLDVYRTLAQQ